MLGFRDTAAEKAATRRTSVPGQRKEGNNKKGGSFTDLSLHQCCISKVTGRLG